MNQNLILKKKVVRTIFFDNCEYFQIWPSRKNFPEFQMGLRFDVASDQLNAQPQSYYNSEKKTSHNVEKHLYRFDIN